VAIAAKKASDAAIFIVIMCRMNNGEKFKIKTDPMLEDAIITVQVSRVIRAKLNQSQ
jgi:hypothetical protein